MASCRELSSATPIGATLALFVVVLIAAGCAKDGVTDGGAPCPDTVWPSPPDAAEPGEDTQAPKEPPYHVTTSCLTCHVPSALFHAPTGAGLPPGTWMALAGDGLVRYAPTAPLDNRVQYELRWPRRGTHEGLERADCGACHPVRDDGVGHGVAQYGPVVRDSAHASGGRGCAASCHGWVGETFVATAPYAWPTEGETVVTPADPERLLQAADGSAHTRMWEAGFSAEVQANSLRLGRVGPGCGGCHNATHDRHGALATCTTCHDFDGPAGALHTAHEAAIAVGRTRFDPSLPEEETCLYCHNRNDPELPETNERYRAACYNCHLSGHQPVRPDGRAHFWPLSEEETR